MQHAKHDKKDRKFKLEMWRIIAYVLRVVVVGNGSLTLFKPISGGPSNDLLKSISCEVQCVIKAANLEKF